MVILEGIVIVRVVPELSNTRQHQLDQQEEATASQYGHHENEKLPPRIPNLQHDRHQAEYKGEIGREEEVCVPPNGTAVQ